MTQETKVTQADREAAANYWAERGMPDDAQARTRAGECDNMSFVQAFARHRLASTEAADALLREISPHMQWFLDKLMAASPEELRETYWMSAFSTRKANDLGALLARIDAHLKGASHEQG